LPILERPVLLWLHLRRFACQACHHRPWETSETFGSRVKWTERLYRQVRAEFLGGCPSRELARRYGLSERTVFRWTFERSRGGRPRQLVRPLGSMSMLDARDTVTTPRSSTWTKADPLPPSRVGGLRM
jgi:hypothetical protein